jgi:hypothetical protein
VKSRPEKHIAAMQIKNRKSTIIPRKALRVMTMVNVSTNEGRGMGGTYKTITLLDIAKKASLGKRMHAPQARISKAASEKYSDNGLLDFPGEIKVYAPSLDVSPLTRRPK